MPRKLLNRLKQEERRKLKRKCWRMINQELKEQPSELRRRRIKRLQNNSRKRPSVNLYKVVCLPWEVYLILVNQEVVVVSM